MKIIAFILIVIVCWPIAKWIADVMFDDGGNGYVYRLPPKKDDEQ